MSDYFHFQRGCRQGGPNITVYLYLMCSRFRKKIRKGKEVRGIKIIETEFKLSKHADDIQIFLDG